MKKSLKKIASVLLAGFCALALPVSVSADGGSRPLYAEDIQNGTYDVEVTSTSSMFRVVACKLTVTDEGMTAHLTLSGQGFGKLYLGRGAEAEKEDEGAFYLYGEDEEGRHTFDIPVERDPGASLAFPKGSDELVALADEWLTQIKADGTFTGYETEAIMALDDPSILDQFSTLNILGK